MVSQQEQRKAHKRLLFLLCIVIMLLGCLFGYAQYTATADELRKSLEVRTATIAELIDTSYITELAGDESDLATSQYQELKQDIIDIKTINTDLRFLYIIRANSPKLVNMPVFLVDSELPGTDGYSAPGEIYEEASPALQQALQQRRVFTEGPLADSYGEWISGLTSIVDDKGKVVGVVGMDISADQYRTTLMNEASPPVIAALAMVILLIAAYLRIARQFADQDLQAEIVSVASHDLRSPLTGIVWAAQSAGQATDPQQVKKLVTSIEQTATDLRMTVNTLLDLAIRKHTIDKGLELAPVYAHELLQGVVSVFVLSANARQLTISVDPATDKTAVIMADNERLRRAVANLVNNAVKYCREGGVITVGAARTDKEVILTVQDNGIGIPKKDQQRIMQGYARAANTGTTEGSGLGIVLVQRIVQAHGGRVWFESVEGQGTTWFIALPAVH